MATLRLFRTACACLTMCPFVMCGGDGRVLTRVSALFVFVGASAYISKLGVYVLLYCGVRVHAPLGLVG